MSPRRHQRSSGSRPFSASSRRDIVPSEVRPAIEELRAALGAPLSDTVDQLLERASLRAGRQLFTVQQARAALAQLDQADQVAPEFEPVPGVLDLADVLDREKKRPDQSWCPGSR